MGTRQPGHEAAAGLTRLDVSEPFNHGTGAVERDVLSACGEDHEKDSADGLHRDSMDACAGNRADDVRDSSSRDTSRNHWLVMDGYLPRWRVEIQSGAALDTCSGGGGGSDGSIGRFFAGEKASGSGSELLVHPVRHTFAHSARWWVAPHW